MKLRYALLVPALLSSSLAVASAQETTLAVASSSTVRDSSARDTTTKDTTTAAPATTAASARASMMKPIIIQHIRPIDQRGVNVFEWPKKDNVPFNGFAVSFGAAFTQQFQGLSHSNTADARMVTSGGSTYNSNQLIPIGHGFNNAVANLYLDAQLAKGIRVAMTSYLSARHHQESWVKDGYVLIDDSPIDNPVLNSLMKYMTMRFGHYEINYGDMHFRRTDNGNAMWNPFVGNLIMDAFTTEIGAEVYLRPRGAFDGMFVMGGITGGEVRGQITVPQKRSPAFLGKIGFDRQVTEDVRFRLSGSVFSQAKSANQTLYGGDRAGSRYYDVMENVVSTETSQAWSGNIRGIFGSKLNAFVVNPFIKVRGLELFGNLEHALGRNIGETSSRTWNQYAGEAVYRFDSDKLYIGGRYNTASGELPLTSPANATSNFKVGADRFQVGGGWFVTPSLLAKAEWVDQKYNDFPSWDIRNGGKFNGFMIEGVVGF